MWQANNSYGIFHNVNNLSIHLVKVNDIFCCTKIQQQLPCHYHAFGSREVLFHTIVVICYEFHIPKTELKKYEAFNCLEVWCPLNPLESDLIEGKFVELSERIQCSSGTLSNGYKRNTVKYTILPSIWADELINVIKAVLIGSAL